MTYVQYIDCDKWKKIIGIVLWSGATIGLGYGFYELVQVGFYLPGQSCFHDTFYSEFSGKTWEHESCYSDGGYALGFLWFITIVSNGVNSFMIWYAINSHYRFIELRCGIKPKSRVNDFGVEVQDHNGVLPKTEGVK